MSGPSTYQPQNAFLKWFEARLPIGGLIHSSFVVYPTPRNLNYWWTFGGILMVMLTIQLLTGIVLAMHYTANVTMAGRSLGGYGVNGTPSAKRSLPRKILQSGDRVNGNT